MLAPVAVFRCYSPSLYSIHSIQMLIITLPFSYACAVRDGRLIEIARSNDLIQATVRSSLRPHTLVASGLIQRVPAGLIH
jgi:hypothetical protein